MTGSGSIDASSLSRREAAAALMAAAGAYASPSQQQQQQQHSILQANRAKVLLAVAHPDDEYYCAAVIYRLARELGSQVDQAIITNGEGGYRYSALAERYYGVALTAERDGRARLPQIRKRETLAAGRILGIRRHHFLNQRDHRFTLDANETMHQVWNCEKVRRTLAELMQRERYDFVFTMLPRDTTHGHHQAATLLALEAAQQLPAEQRPIVLAAEPAASHQDPNEDVTIAQRFGKATFAFAFDRTRHVAGAGLRYDIVVRWMIAEHKSQGLFQDDAGRHDIERYWRLGSGEASHADAEAIAALRRILNETAAA